jgi:hypothetical protein
LHELHYDYPIDKIIMRTIQDKIYKAPIIPDKIALTIVKLRTNLLNIINMTKTINEIVNGNGTIFVLDDDVDVEFFVLLFVLLFVLFDKTQIFEVFVYPIGQAVKHNVALKLMYPDEQLVTH